jgi:hypothetical protein
VNTKSSKTVCVGLSAVILLLLGFAAYQSLDSKEISGAIATATTLVWLLTLLCLDLIEELTKFSRNRQVTVLIQNYRRRQWFATVEVDQKGRLLAPKDPLDRVLAPAKVSKETNIFRAPYIHEDGTMLGEMYQVPPQPFGE